MPITGPTIDHHEIRTLAESHSAVPVEVLPIVVDGEPALLRLMLKEQAGDRSNVLVGWEAFFSKFDALGLAFVYENESTGYNEILQREEHSAYLHPDHRSGATQN